MQYSLHEIHPFEDIFHENGLVVQERLNHEEDGITEREALARYLLLSVVLDQGPEMDGVRELLMNTVNQSYDRGIRFLHHPIIFFNNLNSILDMISEIHDDIKERRGPVWAENYNKQPEDYCLYFAQTPFGMKPNTLVNYVIHRWGAPLATITRLNAHHQRINAEPFQPQVNYIESFASAEKMCTGIKKDVRYGLGDAIGNKACHLYTKYYLNRYNLITPILQDQIGWQGISYEMPFDSNAGRVLFRTGFLFNWAELRTYREKSVIQRQQGENRPNYIRVTNIRNMTTNEIQRGTDEFNDYLELVVNHQIYEGRGRPRMAAIRHVPNLILYWLNEDNNEFTIADFDDGLMYIGTRNCLNTPRPNCESCLISEFCIGWNEDRTLITDYET
jgi:hypothetical protein